uniref:Uncharacterized protein n=1 Tax=Hyaloperonospora arabidopsidis (strain Emoy2) TaxID=559515 RepID=M4BEN1_HYAAE
MTLRLPKGSAQKSMESGPTTKRGNDRCERSSEIMQPCCSRAEYQYTMHVMRV